MTSETIQYLTFRLGEETFAISISHVLEITEHCHITKVPRMPAHFCGVMNLRGDVVSVIDLRLKFSIPSEKELANTCIVIAEVSLAGEMTKTGILTDSVEAVIHLFPGQIEPPPRFGTKLDTKFISGIGKQDNEMIIILDIEKVIACEDSAAENSGENTVCNADIS